MLELRAVLAIDPGICCDYSITCLVAMNNQQISLCTFLGVCSHQIIQLGTPDMLANRMRHMQGNQEIPIPS